MTQAPATSEQAPIVERCRETAHVISQYEPEASNLGEMLAEAADTISELLEALEAARLSVAADVEDVADEDSPFHNFLPLFSERLAKVDAAIAKARGQ